MCCECCGETQRKVWVFGSGSIFLIIGIVLFIIWPNIAENIVYNDLIIKDGAGGYDNWVEAPVPIYLEFTMFNWTNPEDIRNPNIKPNFVEMGPYVFLEKHLKQNITFYPNDTVSYYEQRTWFFDAERSNGTLDDMLTQAHVVTATVADQMRHKNRFIKKVINFMLNREGGKLFTTKPVGAWIFDGYQDDLIDFLRLFNSSRTQMPFTRFGWLVDRNGSVEYDGLFTIHTGADDIMNLGKLTHWNSKNESGFYEPPCGVINGTTGDLFPPKMDTTQEITIYTTDACRYMNFAPDGTMERHGITATKWAGTIETLDSGENYPNQKCFCNPLEEECPKTGVVDCKKCRDDAPIYASFPHFYLADPTYQNAVSGLSPDEEKHKFTLAVEPRLGVPVQVNGRLQINLMMEPDKDYDIYRGVQKVLMPMFWFEQKVELTKDLANRAKLALNLEDYGFYAAIVFTTIGAIFLVTGIVLTITKRWKRHAEDDQVNLAQ